MSVADKENIKGKYGSIFATSNKTIFANRDLNLSLKDSRDKNIVKLPFSQTEFHTITENGLKT